MSDRTIPETSTRSDWPRLVAQVVNRHSRALEGFPWPMLDAAPDNPTEGRTYYDLTTHKTRTYDGTAWQDHW